jgi:hypothetical protein
MHPAFDVLADPAGVSDHLPILLTLSPERPPSSLPPRIPSHLRFSPLYHKLFGEAIAKHDFAAMDPWSALCRFKELAFATAKHPRLRHHHRHNRARTYRESDHLLTHRLLISLLQRPQKEWTSLVVQHPNLYNQLEPHPTKEEVIILCHESAARAGVTWIDSLPPATLTIKTPPQKITALTDPDGTPIPPERHSAVIADFFGSIFRARPTTPGALQQILNAQATAPIPPVPCPPLLAVSLESLTEIIKYSRKSAAPGPDGIPNWVWNIYPEVAAELLLRAAPASPALSSSSSEGWE